MPYCCLLSTDMSLKWLFRTSKVPIVKVVILLLEFSFSLKAIACRICGFFFKRRLTPHYLTPIPHHTPNDTTSFIGKTRRWNSSCLSLRSLLFLSDMIWYLTFKLLRMRSEDMFISEELCRHHKADVEDENKGRRGEHHTGWWNVFANGGVHVQRFTV